MVRLEEVVDEEFLRPQEGPQDDDDWDTDSGTYPNHQLFATANLLTCVVFRIRHLLHRLPRPLRNALRAHHRPARHHPRPLPTLHILKIPDALVVDKDGASLWRQDVVGSGHECAAFGRAVGAGV